MSWQPRSSWRLAALAWLGLAGLGAQVQAQAQPAALQGLKLVDQRGAALTPDMLRGRPLLMHFVYTGCSATCPLQVRELAAMHAALPPGFAFLSVTVDPANDTPATLAAFARRLDAERPGWRFATGQPQQVELLIERMRALDSRKPGAGPADHRTTLFLFDARGELLQRFAGVPVDQARLLREIRQLAALPTTALAATTLATPAR